MLASLAFEHDCYGLPPLDIFCAAVPDENLRRLAAELEDDGHHVRVARSSAHAFAEICTWAPDVLLIDASGPEGVSLARRVRAQFGGGVVLVGLQSPSAALQFMLPVGLFTYLLPRPARFDELARLLGLQPELNDAALVGAHAEPVAAGAGSLW